MNLSDPKFAAQVRRVTLIFSLITMVTSVAGIAVSLYALDVALKRGRVEEILAHPGQYPEETKMVDCLTDGEVQSRPRIFCEHFGGEVRASR